MADGPRGDITWDTRPIQASLFGREGKWGSSIPPGTPSPTLVALIGKGLRSQHTVRPC